MQRSVHVGGGSLGLGLVVATLAEVGVAVTVVDADAALVAELDRRGGYDLEVHDGAAVRSSFVPLAGAVAVGDGSAALAKALAGAELITTSVRVPNLPSVAGMLAGALPWSALGRGSGRGAPQIVACENLVGSSRTLAAAVPAVASWDDARRARVFLDAEVDRICQTAWPKRAAVTTEPFREWVVQDPEGALAAVPAVHRVADLAPYFDRKRAFVNAVADACSFLGRAHGHRFLHEAVRDPRVRAATVGLERDLIRHVARWSEFGEVELERYAATSRERLANPGIGRLIETVARDLVRKLAPGERFVEPALALLRRGEAPTGIAEVVARLLDAEARAGVGAGPAADPAAAGDPWALDWASTWGGDDAARRLWSMVRERRGAA